jgi:hypothetical protein
VQTWSKFVGGLVTTFLSLEVEKAGVVFVVGLLKKLAEPLVDVSTIHECQETTVVFNVPVFADAEEDNSVNDGLNSKVEFSLGQLGIAEREVLSKRLAPRFDLIEKGIIDTGCSPLGSGTLCELVKRAFEYSVAAEDRGDPIPLLSVFAESAAENASHRGGVVLNGSYVGIVNNEFLKVAQDAEWELGAPRIASELEGRRDVFLDKNRGLLGLEEKLARATDAETVVGGLGSVPDTKSVLVDDISVGFSETLLVMNVPPEGFPERIEEVVAELSFVVLTGAIGILVKLEALHKTQD